MAELAPIFTSPSTGEVGAKRRVEDWPWSSARAHLAGRDDGPVRVAPLLDLVADWRIFPAGGVDAGELAAIHRHSRTGRPLGSDAFVEALESRLGRAQTRSANRGADTKRRKRICIVFPIVTFA